MNSISRALEKQRQAQDGIAPGAPSPSGDIRAEHYPVGSILRNAALRRSAEGEAARRNDRRASPRRSRPRAAQPIWLYVFGAIALAAIGAGFFGPLYPSFSPEPPAATKPLAAPVAERAAAPDQNVKETAFAPRPEPTPLTIRVQVESVGAAPAPTPEPAKEADSALKPALPPAMTQAEPEKPMKDYWLPADEAAEKQRAVSARQPSGDPRRDYKLEGIFYHPENGAAIINDRIVEVGDAVGPMTVRAIATDHVLVEINGAQYDLWP